MTPIVFRGHGSQVKHCNHTLWTKLRENSLGFDSVQISLFVPSHIFCNVGVALVLISILTLKLTLLTLHTQLPYIWHDLCLPEQRRHRFPPAWLSGSNETSFLKSNIEHNISNIAYLQCTLHKTKQAVTLTLQVVMAKTLATAKYYKTLS